MRVVAVARDAAHRFTKPCTPEIRLLAGLGVEGDSHAGVTVQHRSRVRRDPSQPNLRQVHLVHSELFADLAERGFVVAPGDIGENVTTAGVPLLDLPTGTLVRLGADAVVELTGLRNPCVQLDRFQSGLMSALLHRDAAGGVVRLAGVMAVVRAGGVVRAGDQVRVELPEDPHVPLQPV
jgi:MOSC domain-containing protein YiiM